MSDLAALIRKWMVARSDISREWPDGLAAFLTSRGVVVSPDGFWAMRVTKTIPAGTEFDFRSGEYGVAVWHPVQPAAEPIVSSDTKGLGSLDPKVWGKALAAKHDAAQQPSADAELPAGRSGVEPGESNPDDPALLAGEGPVQGDLYGTPAETQGTVPISSGPTDQPRCYTCNGWDPVTGVRRRETVGLVCQTCGTDYGAKP